MPPALAHNAGVVGGPPMQNVIVTLVLLTTLAQPKPRPVAEPPRYVPIPLPDNAEQLLKSIEIDRLPIPPGIANEIRAAVEKMRSQTPIDIPPALEPERANIERLATQFLEAHPELKSGMKIDGEEVRRFLDANRMSMPGTLKQINVPLDPDAPAPAQPTSKPQTLDQRIGRWLCDWLQNEETGGRLVEFMRDSPAFNDALDDLLRSVHEVDGGWQPNLPDVPNEFEPPRLPGLGEFPKLGMPELPDATGWLPKMPRLQMPTFKMPLFPDFSSPSLPDVGGDWPQMLLAVLLVVGLLLGIRMWALKGPPPAQRALLALPASIATRADLRRAFEALALNRFGDEARPWNHRHVAHRLGGGPAAAELTRLYEQARYAPGDGPLSVGDRASADRCLAQLAGGAE
jgi:hypothetical protein